MVPNCPFMHLMTSCITFFCCSPLAWIVLFKCPSHTVVIQSLMKLFSTLRLVLYLRGKLRMFKDDCELIWWHIVLILWQILCARICMIPLGERFVLDRLVTRNCCTTCSLFHLFFVPCRVQNTLQRWENSFPFPEGGKATLVSTISHNHGDFQNWIPMDTRAYCYIKILWIF